jgi:nucleotide-binding universal stress UspA family protein/hemerythrin-like domain-containing protein
MYRHLLVPTDGSDLSVENISHAVEFARGASARITFFHATPDYFATQEGALMRTLSPEFAREQAAGQARAILSKAEAAARAVGVNCNSVSRVTDRPHQAILQVAEEEGCDLIVMASHGPRSIGGLMLGSETLKVLVHSRIPVLVSTVERNVAVPAMNKAIAIIIDEHRSMAAVIHGLKYLIGKVREDGRPPDFGLLKAMLGYINAFPNALHHPKEEDYLFRKLQARSVGMGEIIADLERQHIDDRHMVKDLEQTLKQWEAGAPEGPGSFAQAVENYAQALWKHMSVEEKEILPAARRHLTADDWAEVAEAFGKNGDPRFGAEPDEGYRKLFARIMNLAPSAAE